MRILFISRSLPYTGGRETFLSNLIDNLKGDHEVALSTPDSIYHENIKVYKHNKDTIEQTIESFKPDIVNCHTHYLVSESINICKKRNIPFVLTLHGNIFEIGNQESIDKFYKYYEKLSALVFVSSHGKEEIGGRIKSNKPKLQVIYNGINKTKFNSDLLSLGENKNLIRNIYDISCDKFIFVTPARMAWYKGLDFMLDTLIENKEFLHANNVQFILATPSTRFRDEELLFMDKLLDRVYQNDIESLLKIIFASYEHMPIVYRMVDGFILPSVSEQFPISILEAMSSRVPVIATKVGGVPELVNDASGYLVEHGNNKSLHSAICKVVEDRQATQNKINYAQKVVHSQYLINHSSQKYEKLFKELLFN